MPSAIESTGLRPGHAGRRYPATEPYVVSAAKIAEFATAIADQSPAYHGSDPIAPPTFAMVIAAQAWQRLFDDPELGLRLDHTIHTDQSFEWVRPLRVGDAVTATLTISSVRQRRGTDIIGLAVSLDTPAGEHLATASSTLWHTREDAS
ncbi:MaoC family dehydratase N-terminal domain-containing protein [Acidipropionibacterium jensenii]|uniref:MaoC family dehydratase N-terminal domain-containing protein n=1 Tax=Acidipropionibacterium jensenii TaxID=1749 RepID=UPI00214D0650|nr:MaoC family dehydratase N-terminal domain-containing protein [Acidipropionibacterium jensenii]